MMPVFETSMLDRHVLFEQMRVIDLVLQTLNHLWHLELTIFVQKSESG